MTRDLLFELSMLFLVEAESIERPYAWPPRAAFTPEEKRELDRLRACSQALQYRARAFGEDHATP